MTDMDQETKIISAATAAHEVNRTYCQSIGDDSQQSWRDAPDWQKESAIAGVRALLANPNLTPKEQHELWTEHKKKDGWVYGEKKSPEKKTHPCMVQYADLPLAQRAKDIIYQTVVLAHLGIDWAKVS